MNNNGREVIRIYGAPGTGKTTYLINEMMKGLKEKRVKPEKIMFTTFTKSAGLEARRRVEKQLGIGRKKLKWFGNIHSLCFKKLGYKRSDVVKEEEIEELMKKKGIEYKRRGNVTGNEEELVLYIDQYSAEGNFIMYVIDQCRLRDIKISEWMKGIDKYTMDMCMKRFGVTTEDIEMIREYYEEWKEENDKVDFIDMIEYELLDEEYPDIRWLIIDEMQDTYPLIMKLYRKYMDICDVIYMAGDPYQTIYEWCGADPYMMLNIDVDSEVVLGKSYRLPELIWEKAKALIYKKYGKEKYYDLEYVKARKGQGWFKKIEDGTQVYEILRDYVKNRNGYGKRTIYVLCRTRRYVVEFCKNLLINGIPFNVIKGANQIWTDGMVRLYNVLLKIEENKKGIPHTYGIDEIKTFIRYMPGNNIIVKYGYKKKIDGTIESTRLFHDKYTIKDIEDMLFINIKEYGIVDLIEKSLLSNNQKKALKSYIANNHYRRIESIDIHVGTIHSAKGLEADTVFLCLDEPYEIRTNLLMREIELSETRVIYVGMTRAKKELYLFRNCFNYESDDVWGWID